jgi:hypothetical protein
VTQVVHDETKIHSEDTFVSYFEIMTEKYKAVYTLDKNDKIDLRVSFFGIARKFIMRDIDFSDNLRIFTCFLFYVFVMYIYWLIVYTYIRAI